MAIWPFIPQQEPRESLEWETAVLRPYSTEQRQSLRAVPVQRFEFAYHLTGRQHARARALADHAGDNAFALPVWTDRVAIGSWPSGQQTLTIDGSYLDFRDGGTALLIQDDETYRILSVADAGGGDFDLDAGSPASITYSPAWIVPLRDAYLVDGLSRDRGHPTTPVAKVEWEVLDNADLAAAHDFDTYRSYPVMTDRAIVAGSFREQTERRLEVIDSSLAQPYVDPRNDQSEHTSLIAWDLQTAAALWRVRQWLHRCRGKWRAFWLPTWAEDLTLTDDIDSADTTIRVQPIGYPDRYTVTDIMVLKTDGTRYYRRVNSGAVDGDDEVLTLSAAFGADVDMADVDRICFLILSRHAVDRVQIQHQAVGAKITIGTVSVPDEGTPADNESEVYLTRDASVEGGEPVGLLTFSRGATEWLYTTDPDDYTFDGDTYAAVAGGFGLPDLEASEEAVRNRPDVDVSRENDIALLFHRASPTDAIGVIWREVMRGDTDVVTRFSGRVSGASWNSKGGATLHWVSVEDDSNEPNGLKFAISLTCQADLFDEYCGLDRADWDHATTVVSVDGATIDLDSVDGALPYEGGEIVFTDDNGNFDRRMIESIDTSGANPVVTLFRPFTGLIATDAVTIYPSCDHTIETCESIFGNKLNCRCRPHLSTKNPMAGQGIL